MALCRNLLWEWYWKTYPSFRKDSCKINLHRLQILRLSPANKNYENESDYDLIFGNLILLQQVMQAGPTNSS